MTGWWWWSARTSAIWTDCPAPGRTSAPPVLADLAVIDASFISLRLVLPPTLNLLKPTGQVIALIKPQFEAGRSDVGKGGVVRDVHTHARVIHETADLAQELGLSVAGLTVSPAPGPAGNIEFLIWLRKDGAGG